MTYAGLKSMLYAAADKNDPRVKAAVAWLRRHWSVSENPGMGQVGIYYYYHTMAKALATLGEDHFVDAMGTKHAWRVELFDELARRQNPNGSWTNSADRWYEGDPNLVTGYVLMALSHCKPAAAAK
jgi:squalene-hopene/tetraprenyl-beta-curcumene cyclase